MIAPALIHIWQGNDTNMEEIINCFGRSCVKHPVHVGQNRKSINNQMSYLAPIRADVCYAVRHSSLPLWRLAEKCR